MCVSREYPYSAVPPSPHGKSLEIWGGGGAKPEHLKESMMLNLNFQRGGDSK